MITWFWSIAVFLFLGIGSLGGSILLDLPVQQRLSVVVLFVCAGVSTMFANCGMQFRCPMKTVRNIFVEVLRWVMLCILINHMYTMYSFVVFCTILWFWTVLESAQPCYSIYDRNTYYD